ncbi:MAG: hypothetical protein BMS9Abin12_1026 [Acidimicrobiia bacterium]|nr:MAG: hypothetical protein BMS9Abin12_1026 [Acidimicrobiia bacterium]
MISVGTSASISLTVSEADTAIALGSGDVAVLGTPRVVALCEEAAVAALAGSLPRGMTSVGIRITVDHTKATGIGGRVTAKATVSAVDGKRISFVVELFEGDRTTANGTHTRIVVSRKRFEESVDR